MEQKGLLSVIVPVYKVEAYLHRCIDSIRNQTYKQLQIILVDDGSPDGCGKICDDWLHPEMYERLIALIEKNDLDMARCSVIGSDGTKEEAILPHKKGLGNQLITGSDVFELYFTEFLCKVVWNAVYKRHIVIDILSPERCHSQDNYVSGRYLYRSQRMMITDECLYYYYKNPTSTTHGGHKRFLDICICTEKLRDDLIHQEHMRNSSYIDRLNKKLAREFFHFVRVEDDRYRLQSMEREQKRFIDANLDFFRRLRFDWLLRKKKISLY